MDVFLLWHKYELRDDFGTHDEVKLIGAFSSERSAQEAVRLLRGREGFRDFPLRCFAINNMEIDHMNWADGFSTVRWTE